jgi:8-oxo-dGTP pyrophosphatase MutT (NUDIX family)
MPKRALRPKDAATLILVRNDAEGPAVLVGQRHSGHTFMPDHYVFPGGRVDRADNYVVPATPLRTEVTERLARSCTPRRAQALAMAAVRETFEETGLLLGQALGERPKRVPEQWRPFFANGCGPALDRLTYLCRAITPTYRPRRFNTRFFLADADGLTGELGGSGELVDLHWVPIHQARALPIPRITNLVLGHLEEYLTRPRGSYWPVPLYRQLYGKHTLSYE